MNCNHLFDKCGTRTDVMSTEYCINTCIIWALTSWRGCSPYFYTILVVHVLNEVLKLSVLTCLRVGLDSLPLVSPSPALVSIDPACGPFLSEINQLVSPSTIWTSVVVFALWGILLVSILTFDSIYLGKPNGQACANTSVASVHEIVHLSFFSSNGVTFC